MGKTVVIKFLFAFVLLIGMGFARGATPESPDSLLLRYQFARDDSVKNISLRALVDYWKNKNFDSCIVYAGKLVDLAKKTNQPHHAYKGLFWLANAYAATGKNDSASFYAFQGIKMYQNDTSRKGKYYCCSFNMMLGEQYRALSQFDNALPFFHKSMELAEENNFSGQLANVTNRLAATYFELKNKPEALRWADSSLYLSILQNNITLQINNLLIKAAIERDNGNYRLALQSFLKVLDFQQSQDDPMGLPPILNNIATTYSYLNDCNNAIKYAQQSYAIAEKNHQITYSVVALDLLAKCYALTGQYKEAYRYSRLYEETRHQIFNEERDAQINTLSAKYKSEEKDKLIAIQKLDIEKQTNALKRNNILLIASLIILVLIITFLANRIIMNRKLRKAHELQKQQTELIKAQKDEIEHYAEEMKSTYEQLQKLDKHKQAMTNMIVHDLKSPISVLSDIDMFGSEEEKRPVIKAISSQMMNLVLNMLDVSKAEEGEMQLAKTEINLFELVNRVIEEADYFIKDKNIHIVNKINPFYFIKADRDITKRILNNLLGNAIKFSYSNSKIIFDTMVADNGNLLLSIRDFGVGIAIEHQELIFERFKQFHKSNSGNIKSTGLGLAFCKMAANAHGWEIKVESEPGKGATFSLEISEYINKG